MYTESVVATPAPALSVLLASLSSDREQAGAKYEQLRHKLILYFAARECKQWTEELADRTLDAVARRLQEGVEIYTRDISSYCYGVAQNILRDYRKGAKVEPLTYDPVAAPSSVAEGERRLRCLDECLNELPPESRHLIRSYYQDERRAKIDHRQQLAGQLGITTNALRLRAHQIRMKLESCLKACVDRGPEF